MKEYTKDPIDIKQLPENAIFVFGSNLRGIHGSGAAKVARDEFGAQLGIGEGLTGRAYAFPTVSQPGMINRLNGFELERCMGRFMKCVEENKDKKFYLTKIGCGLAGIPIYEMKEIFCIFYDKNIHTNLVYPKEFEKE